MFNQQFERFGTNWSAYTIPQRTKYSIKAYYDRIHGKRKYHPMWTKERDDKLLQLYEESRPQHTRTAAEKYLKAHPEIGLKIADVKKHIKYLLLGRKIYRDEKAPRSQPWSKADNDKFVSLVTALKTNGKEINRDDLNKIADEIGRNRGAVASRYYNSEIIDGKVVLKRRNKK
jgi:hypothetical protein